MNGTWEETHQSSPYLMPCTTKRKLQNCG